MVRVYRKGPQTDLRPSFCFGLALLILIFPFRWVAAWILASVVHELCHYAMLTVCGVQVLSVSIGFSGAVIETDSMNAREEFICALSGPAGGLLLLLLAKWLPCTALCAAFQSAYNLLPLGSLDGSRAVRCVVTHVFPGSAATICRCLEMLVLVAIFVLSIYGAVILKLGVMPLLAAVILAGKCGAIKIPCKYREQALQ